MNWKKSDAAKLRNYLNSTNSKLLRILDEAKPELEQDTIEAVALSAKKREGFELSAKVILDLANDEGEDDDGSEQTFSPM